MKVEDAIVVTVSDNDSDFASEMLYLIENNNLSFNDIINILNCIAEIRDVETNTLLLNERITKVIYENENVNEI